jgi:hypothetical protein
MTANPEHTECSFAIAMRFSKSVTMEAGATTVESHAGAVRKKHSSEEVVSDPPPPRNSKLKSMDQPVKSSES